MIPFLIAALVISVIFCRNVNTVTRPRIDVLSILLSTIGFGGIVCGFSFTGEWGWTNIAVILSLSVGILSLVLFSLRQLAMEKPMMGIRAFKYPMFTIGTLLVVIVFGLIMSSMLLLPMYWQSGKLVAVVVAGLLLLPGGIVNGIVSSIAGKLYDLYGPIWLVRFGFILCVIAAAMLVNIETSSTYILVVGANILLMIGIPFVMSPAQTNGLNALPQELSPDGSAIMNTAQQVSGAIATALTATILAAGENSYFATGGHASAEALANGVKYGFIFTLVLAVIGFVISFFVKPARVFKPKKHIEKKRPVRKETRFSER